MLRVDPETKARLEEAARRQGLSLTSFLLQAAEHAAGRVKPMSTGVMKPRGRGACPTFFVAQCHEARRGGGLGYRDAGWTLLRSIAGLCDYHVEEEEWARRLDELAALLDAGDEGGVWEWLQREVPRCMALVPARRRGQFLAGVFQAYEEDDGILQL
jgi:hypothetical protein